MLGEGIKQVFTMQVYEVTRTVDLCALFGVILATKTAKEFGNLSVSTEVFPCFSSVVRQMPRYNSQRRARPAIFHLIFTQ